MRRKTTNLHCLVNKFDHEQRHNISCDFCTLYECFLKMCSPFKIDIRPRRLPAEIRQIEESSNDHGNKIYFKHERILFDLTLLFLICSKGIRCYIQNDCYESLEAIVPGPKETPYEEIQFKIAMEFDSHYPFRPPSAKFITPVYHPNIDTGNSKMFLTQ